jgi:hypothetical protein
MPRILLKTEDHSRDSSGMRYVYPVISRRAGGVSVGINLNPNNACNWRCIYCQVPDLKRGGPPPIDLGLLERELDDFLNWVCSGDFMTTRVPEGARQLVDVAFSGNGEPTSAPEFADAVARVERVLAAHDLTGKLIVRLITNGSLLDRKAVRESAGAEVKSGSNSIRGRRPAWPASTAPAPGPTSWRDVWRAAPRWRRPGCRPVCSGWMAPLPPSRNCKPGWRCSPRWHRR